MILPVFFFGRSPHIRASVRVLAQLLGHEISIEFDFPAKHLM